MRLGEIGFAAPYNASALWTEAPKHRKKQAGAGTSSSAERGLSAGKAINGVKPPRIRPLEHVAGDKAAIEEEWSVVEPAAASADEAKVAQTVTGDGAAPVSTLIEEQQAKRRRGFVSKANGKVRGKGPGGARSGWASTGKQDEATISELPVDTDLLETREGEEKEKESLPLQADDEAPFLAEISSGSEELMGSELKGNEELPADDSGNGASDGSEEHDTHANPNSHGDEMQGAIEDGPGQANGNGFITVKQRGGERRSGRQTARGVIACRDIVSRDTVSRDTSGEPSGRFQAATAAPNGTTIITPSSSQRVSLSSGVSGWLQEFGLSKYAELFELNEVDTEVLPLLTMDDLREMGVDAVGARRKMFTAIQELGQLRGI